MSTPSGRCAEIARNLLNFSRTTEIRIKEHNLHDIIGKTLDILRHRAEMNNIGIVTSYSPDVPPVYCDFSRIQQALMNIFWNAIEAMPEGGVLTVSTSYEPAPMHPSVQVGQEHGPDNDNRPGGRHTPENCPRFRAFLFNKRKERGRPGPSWLTGSAQNTRADKVQSEPGERKLFLVPLPSEYAPLPLYGMLGSCLKNESPPVQSHSFSYISAAVKEERERPRSCGR